MDRKMIEKKIRKALIILYVSAFLLEAIALWLIIPNNNMDILTVSFTFPQILAILLAMNVPLFLFTAIMANAIKEIVFYMSFREGGKLKLSLSLSSAVCAIVSLLLWIATSNTVSPELCELLFFATILFFLASVITFVLYIIKRNK